jgi:3'(2'), 5'-bisphosphate nucleotidase
MIYKYKVQIPHLEIDKIVQIARDAGDIIMKYYEQSDIDIEQKDDKSPVTIADKKSSEFIVKELHKIHKNIPAISEEADANYNLDLMLKNKAYWLIDPIDGTWSFIRKRGVFTVNIGFIQNGQPIFGVIHSPLDGFTYYNIPTEGAFKTDGIQTNVINPNINNSGEYDFLVSHQNINQKTTDFVNKYKVKTITPIPSSIKLCMLAEGNGDIYPRFKPTYVWDTAAGHAILKEVGGEVYNAKGQPLTYATQLENPSFVAVASSSIIIHEV